MYPFLLRSFPSSTLLLASRPLSFLPCFLPQSLATSSIERQSTELGHTNLDREVESDYNAKSGEVWVEKGQTIVIPLTSSPHLKQGQPPTEPSPIRSLSSVRTSASPRQK